MSQNLGKDRRLTGRRVWQHMRKRLPIVSGCVALALLVSGIWYFLSLQQLMPISREHCKQVHEGMTKAEVYELLGPPTEPTGILPPSDWPFPTEIAIWQGWDCQMTIWFTFDERGEHEQVLAAKAYGEDSRTDFERIIALIRAAMQKKPRPG
jgi:hypothetical protein